jgi:hypothetical protein
MRTFGIEVETVEQVDRLMELIRANPPSRDAVGTHWGRGTSPASAMAYVRRLLDANPQVLKP